MYVKYYFVFPLSQFRLLYNIFFKFLIPWDESNFLLKLADQMSPFSLCSALVVSSATLQILLLLRIIWTIASNITTSDKSALCNDLIKQEELNGKYKHYVQRSFRYSLLFCLVYLRGIFCKLIDLTCKGSGSSSQIINSSPLFYGNKGVY